MAVLKVQEGSKPKSNGRTRGGIQSVDAALTLLKVMAEFDGPATLTEIAQRAHMPSSKAHRYLASFVAADFVDQAERSGRYGLSKAAIEVGLAAIGRLDFVERAADALTGLVELTGASGLVAVWGSHGPTTVRWHRTASFIITSLGLGSTFPLLSSATGRVFLAFSPRRLIAAKLKFEISQARKKAPSQSSGPASVPGPSSVPTVYPKTPDALERLRTVRSVNV